ncbi:MAG: hypothetical protein IJJ72_11175 [Bacteroidales bacterium]|nr:hypothetical protein [Bacteroidales bacterium]
MKRIVLRKLPDGSIRYVQPFHVSMERLEKVILCRDDNDYDAMVKTICVCARRKNVIVIVYAVVSNHSHVAVLAASQTDAEAFGQEVKRTYAMWFSRRYAERRTLHRMDVKAICLDSDWYARNALAYILRNALDNGCNINEYRWCAYRALFVPNAATGCPGLRVASLTKRQRRSLLHTGDSLQDVTWCLDTENRLIPSSFCDHGYLEQAFENDQAFFMKTLGGQNPAEMHLKLIESPRTMLVDSEFYKAVNEISLRWYQTDISLLSMEKKTRLIPYLKRTMKTSIPQLARTVGLGRDRIAEILSHK